MAKLDLTSDFAKALTAMAQQQSARAAFIPNFVVNHKVGNDGKLSTVPSVKDAEGKPVKFMTLVEGTVEKRIRLSAFTQVCRDSDNQSWVKTQTIEEILAILSNNDEFKFEEDGTGLFLGQKVAEPGTDGQYFTSNKGVTYKLVPRTIWKIVGVPAANQAPAE